MQPWIDTIVKLAMQCVYTLQPAMKTGDHLSLLNYVKVKTIPGGDIGECR